MPLSIKNPESEALARELAAVTGESITVAVTRAVRERLERLRHSETDPEEEEAVAALCAQIAALPDLDTRSPDELLGYDEWGLP